MSKLITSIKTFFGDERGITAMEYAVVAGAILAVALTAFTALGTSLSTTISGVTL